MIQRIDIVEMYVDVLFHLFGIFFVFAVTFTTFPPVRAVGCGEGEKGGINTLWGHRTLTLNLAQRYLGLQSSAQSMEILGQQSKEHHRRFPG